ncbi:collagen-like protein [Crocinitomicaceae bacterium]|nr:collagen-like protein [Crocinitomicaceae bacterium]MDC0100224.1 collagen-like protein [Crocinitomicaceae bacterium]MDC1195912.1 collagen-like protein [Crocinitomicaceae bacterium]|tara:strand:- start:12786 stop:13799 length:1014 start_codon:yes stop_codon:yes gene_type:complete
MFFKYSFLTVITALLLLGCADYAKVELANVDYLRIEESPKEKINHGSSCNFEVLAMMKKGNEENITRHPNLKIESEFLFPNDELAFTLKARPLSFEDTSYAVTLFLSNESDSVKSDDQLQLNYHGGLWIHSESQAGINAEPQRKSGVTLFNPNGVDGKPGINGGNGQDGGNYTGYLWSTGNELRFQMENDSTGNVWKYKSLNCDTLFIDLSGADGGNGGTGGEGGNGKNGKGTKLPGNAGNGGNGGTAGSGGDGGSILIFVHKNAESYIPKINVLQFGGQPGINGRGGLAGNPGKPLKGQRNGSLGEHGRNGNQGSMGKSGPNPVISIINFDFQELD